MKITMEAVARKAGVSRNAVSLALRNHPSIPAATRARIQAAAGQLGYQRNPAFGELMSQMRLKGHGARQATLALFNANRDAAAFRTHPTIPEYVKGCERRAGLLGYSLDTFWLHEPGIDGGRWIQILEARGIRGVVLVGLMDENQVPPHFQPVVGRFPAVVTGVRTHDPAISFACVDHHGLALLAVEQALALGYRRPALVLDPVIDRLVEGRFTAGFLIGQRHLARGDRLPPFTQFGDPKRAPARLRAWMRRHRPDAVFTLYNAVRRWLEAGGWRIPEKLGLIQLEWRAAQPEWAGMHQHNDLVGAAAIDMLVGMIHRGESGPPAHPRATLIEPSWQSGRTVKPQTQIGCRRGAEFSSDPGF
ncbi:MAG TPA: LacI family DNA-binding transcriptional regulator [Kiritimatiellia bacterium]|nr:LacI family DNA-binding transcriptional regulator [Kiritimatiellia bacterium]